jgi:tripartite-type tricarboxylate transporter receptor subunit TctC
MAIPSRLTGRGILRYGAVAAAFILLLVNASVTKAQDFPARPLRLVVAFAPGGTTDYVARLVAEKAGAIIGQNVVVENKPGGNGTVAAEFVARSEPDGYTLFFTTLGAMAINPNLRAKLNYDPRAGFDPVALIARNTILLAVKSDGKIKSFAEFVTAAKSQKSVSVGVTGIGAATYLSAVLLQKTLGAKLEIVPYRGASQALADLLGGHIDAMFGEIPVLLAPIKAGTVRPLVSTAQERAPAIADVPTFIELGLTDVVAENWAGVIAPAHTPSGIVDKLSATFERAIADPNVLEQMGRSGVTPFFKNAQQFRSFIDNEIEHWGNVIRSNGVHIE